MPGPVFLEGTDVSLRTIEDDDAEFFQRLINDPRVRISIGSVEAMNHTAEREWIESLGERAGTHLSMCVDGTPVGSISLKPPNEVDGVVEIGYMVVPEQWGNGYATDAVKLLCGYAFDERRLNKVYARAYAGNPGSHRVLEKAGFTQEGRFRQEGFVEGEYVDVLRYGLLANEYHT
ncbi:GNAT family N-acetyltransferase [Halocatena salina]|uniref:GNAT family N-acetyltransferase n=1 Tax=Halocatena salina TaxID=2934340 RepID=A0A8U0A1N9_9EURY|nr:GNAT family protein [Halocatena salina]UPM43065.1 GNAT family N-acetyltransferase [Halocatena salina]